MLRRIHAQQLPADTVFVAAIIAQAEKAGEGHHANHLKKGRGLVLLEQCILLVLTKLRKLPAVGNASLKLLQAATQHRQHRGIKSPE